MASIAVSKFIYDKKLKAMKSVCPMRKNIHGVPRKDICKKICRDLQQTDFQLIFNYMITMKENHGA